MNATKKKTVILADDHQLCLEGLRQLLKDDYDIIATAINGKELIGLVNEYQPDIVITDVSMPEMTGIEALSKLQEGGCQSKIIVLTMHEEPEYAAVAIQSGALGFILKSSAATELKMAIESILEGGLFLSPRIAADTFALVSRNAKNRKTADPKLTARQKEILHLLAEGCVAKEIGSHLDISQRTVEYHKYRLMEMLGVSTTAALIQFAVRKGLV
jgi:DNA-binding NarL/FixJ family response regulator